MKSLFYIISVCFWLIVTLLSVELYFSAKKMYPLSTMQYDSRLGWRYKQGKKEYIDPTGERISLTINRSGFRDKNRSKTSRSDTRILLIGDSYVVCYEVSDNETFPYLIEKRFEKESQPSVELMNAAAGAWATDQQYRYLIEEGLQYAPDVVILLIAPNDIRETYTKSLYTLNNDNTLQEKPMPVITFGNKLAWALSNRSHLFQYVQRKMGTRHGSSYQIFTYFPSAFNINGKEEYDKPLYLKNPPPPVVEAKRLFTTLLLEMNKVTQEHEIHLVLSVIPTKVEYTHRTDGTGKYDTRLIADFVKDFAAREKITYFDIREAIEKTNDPLTYFITDYEYHYNKSGQLFLANFFYEKINELLATKKQSTHSRT